MLLSQKQYSLRQLTVRFLIGGVVAKQHSQYMLSVIFLTSLTPFVIDRPFIPQNSCLDCVLCASTQNRQPAISYFFHVGLVSGLPLAHHSLVC